MREDARSQKESFGTTLKAEGGSAKTKSSRYRAADALKNNLTP
jgi:hypothetical protein